MRMVIALITTPNIIIAHTIDTTSAVPDVSYPVSLNMYLNGSPRRVDPSKYKLYHPGIASNIIIVHIKNIIVAPTFGAMYSDHVDMYIIAINFNYLRYCCHLRYLFIMVPRAIPHTIPDITLNKYLGIILSGLSHNMPSL